MFKIKICGITAADDAVVAVQAGADAVGLNFFPGSRRYVTDELARAIVAAVPEGVLKVGVFVNEPADNITSTAGPIGLAAIQLHGDEPADLLPQFPAGLQLIRAHRCGEAGLAPLAEYLDACRAHGRMPDAVLIDADAGADFGGSGHVADWERIAEDRPLLGGIPLILAGGLTPENVAEAIAAVHPDGVDVASGVESPPGKKDRALVREFVAAAREAFVRYS